MKRLIAIAFIVGLSGCACVNCKDPIVHPTDDQIRRGGSVEKTDDAPYVPWWVSESK